MRSKVAGLRFLGMNWVKISKLLGVSVDTLRRRRHLFGSDLSFQEITDSQLDNLVQEILTDHPCFGERMLQGHLLSKGITIQRARLRESVKRVDPDRSNRFVKRRIFRRSYNVP